MTIFLRLTIVTLMTLHIFFLTSCGSGGSSDTSKDIQAEDNTIPGGQVTDDTDIPIVFVHGTNGTFFNFVTIEGLIGHGFDEKKLFQVLLPAINTKGKYCVDDEGKDCPYNDPITKYSHERWAETGNFKLNTEALKKKIDQALQNTGATQVNLIGHSNGVEVIRAFLGQYPAYATTIRKVIAVSGAKVSNTPCPYAGVFRYMDEITPDWPEGPDYHAISSDSDGVFDWVSHIYCVTGDTRYFEPGVGTNHTLDGMDHLMISSHEETFETIYEILTGRSLASVNEASSVAISGLVTTVNEYGTRQSCATDTVHVAVHYYNPDTGETEPDMVGADVTDGEGSWGPVTVSTDKHLRITYELNGMKKIVYFAHKITQNYPFIEERAPNRNFSITQDGYFRLMIRHQGQFLNRDGYENVPATAISGEMAVNAPETTIPFTGLTAPQYKDSSQWSMDYSPLNKHTFLIIHNVGEWPDTDLSHGNDTGPYVGYYYNPVDTPYPDSTATCTIQMDTDKPTGLTTRIQAESDALMNNTEIVLCYLYPTSR